MKRLILTMLDNNDTIWYEQLVPFLLSLKDTDFDGDIGVISYDLSESKQQALEKFGCKVFPALNRYSELLVDRQITAAHIAETEDYGQLAMFDADIWFPAPHFSLFEQLSDDKTLYCTHDIWKCTFLYDCVNEPFRADISEKLERIMANNGRVWQAGMIAGHKNAWKNYRTYAENQLAQRDCLKMQYGIDATLLNLYAADEDAVRYVSRKYNALPAWGVAQENHGQGIEFMIGDERVEAIHVSRAHRKGGEFSYQQLFHDNYFQHGQALHIKEYSYYHIEKESLCHNTPAENPVQLSLDLAETNGCMVIRADRSGEHYKQNSVLIDTSGCSTLRVKNDSSEVKVIMFYFQAVLNYSLCEQVFLHTATEHFHLEPNKRTAYYLHPNQWAEFQVRELNIDGKRLRWVFEDLKLVMGE